MLLLQTCPATLGLAWLFFSFLSFSIFVQGIETQVCMVVWQAFTDWALVSSACLLFIIYDGKRFGCRVILIKQIIFFLPLAELNLGDKCLDGVLNNNNYESDILKVSPPHLSWDQWKLWGFPVTCVVSVSTHIFALAFACKCILSKTHTVFSDQHNQLVPWF